MSEVEILAAYHLIVSSFVLVDAKKRKCRRRMWVRDILKKRGQLSAANTLFNEMVLSDQESFFNYSRMTRDQFNNLLGRLAPHLEKRSIRKPLPEKDRLLITLRYSNIFM